MMWQAAIYVGTMKVFVYNKLTEQFSLKKNEEKNIFRVQRNSVVETFSWRRNLNKKLRLKHHLSRSEDYRKVEKIILSQIVIAAITPIHYVVSSRGSVVRRWNVEKHVIPAFRYECDEFRMLFMLIQPTTQHLAPLLCVQLFNWHGPKHQRTCWARKALDLPLSLDNFFIGFAVFFAISEVASLFRLLVRIYTKHESIICSVRDANENE